jgi:hypothetical protein
MRASTDDSDDGPGCVFIIPRQPVSDELPSAGELAREMQIILLRLYRENEARKKTSTAVG